MNVPIYFDIETIPSQLPGVMDEFPRSRAGATANTRSRTASLPGSKRNREAEAEAAWLKTSFDGGMGHVCVISWAYGDEAPSSASVREFGDESGARPVGRSSLPHQARASVHRPQHHRLRPSVSVEARNGARRSRRCTSRAIQSLGRICIATRCCSGTRLNVRAGAWTASVA